MQSRRILWQPYCYLDSFSFFTYCDPRETHSVRIKCSIFGARRWQKRTVNAVWFCPRAFSGSCTSTVGKPRAKVETQNTELHTESEEEAEKNESQQTASNDACDYAGLHLDGRFGDSELLVSCADQVLKIAGKQAHGNVMDELDMSYEDEGFCEVSLESYQSSSTHSILSMIPGSVCFTRSLGG